MSNEDSKEPPVIMPPLVPLAMGQQPDSDPTDDFIQWLERVVGAKSYGAPRVFDLFTLLAITLAFALLLACLRVIEPLLLDEMETVAVTLGAFVTGIGIFQLALWGGQKPRLASLVGGPILWILSVAAFHVSQPENLLDPNIVVLTVFSSVLGIPAGYLGGAMVAGVFLLADFFRSKFLKTPLRRPVQNDDQIFAEEPQVLAGDE